MKLLCCFALTVSLLLGQEPTSKEELNLGIAAYKNGNYGEAVNHFKRTVELDPSDQKAQLYLATSYFIQWVPGAADPENQKNYDLAYAQFDAVLAKDPKNSLALAMMASMAYNSAMVGTDEQKAAALDKARSWNLRRIEANPDDPEAYYYLGVIDWGKVYAPIQKQRMALKMAPTDPGPITDQAIRRELQQQYLLVVEEGIAQLNKCLAIDKENEDAMSYVNLLLRRKADLEDSAEAAKKDTDQANEWANRAIEMKKIKAARPPRQ